MVREDTNHGKGEGMTKSKDGTGNNAIIKSSNLPAGRQVIKSPNHHHQINLVTKY